MPVDFVALDIGLPAADRCEVATVLVEGGRERAVLFLLGSDPTAARARGLADEQVEVVVAHSLDAIAEGLLERADEAPWVSFDQASRLEAWREQDTTGALDVVPQLDAGDLAALALAWVPGRSLQGFLAEAAPFVDRRLPAVAANPGGLPAARAVAALWQALPAAIAQRPWALRNELAELLQRARHPLAPTWSAAAQGEAGPDEARSIDGLLRGRLRELTPEAAKPAEPPEPQPIDVEQVRALFAPDGALARVMGRYEPREGQAQMAVAVAQALNEEECLLVEAGTGTGKSLAYLAPAVLFALRNTTKVVISTATKNLQDQLCAKDIPLLGQALDQPFRAELIKGRGNYLCVDKLLREYADSGLVMLDDQGFLLACLLSWAACTNTGDLDDVSSYLLARYPRLGGLARRLASDGETCTALSARGHPCFATVARRRAFEADLLVVNHALALANAAVEVLPPYRHVIFDEAHNLEDIATEAFGLTLERRGLLQQARDAGASRDARSFHNRLRRVLSEAGPEAARDALASLTGSEMAAHAVIEGVDQLGERLAALVLRRLGRAIDDLGPVERLRLDPSVYDDALGATVKTAGENLLARAGDLVRELTNLVTRLAGLRGAGAFGPEVSRDELERLETQAQAAAGTWSETLAGIQQTLAFNDARFVYWLEFALRREAYEWRLRGAPIEAGEELANRVYAQMATVVLTSATLSVDRSFRYFAHRLGLGVPEVAARHRALAVPSPFDYERHVLLGLPVNIALPRDEQFERHVGKAIEELALILEGRTLVLFTSLRAMRQAFDRLEARLAESGIELLCQGVSGSRHVLAERFRTHERAVLFGTRSFWEGIDVPGEALTGVVIVKLPFTVPDDPVFEARCEHLKASGVDPWNEYSVPQAVILFKQGFGRLIRSTTDRGVVICLDRRLVEMRYGRAFLRSVPGYTPVFDTWTEVKARVRDWLHP